MVEALKKSRRFCFGFGHVFKTILAEDLENSLSYFYVMAGISSFE